MEPRDRHPFFDAPAPTILGHRGAAGEAPENTLLAFRTGLAAGAHMLESDVHRTRDGVAVLIHDAELERTTERRARVDELDWAELRELDAAYRFQPGRADGTSETDGAIPDASEEAPLRGRGHGIPSLVDAFEAFPEARFNLEIKAAEPDFAAEVVALTREVGREHTTLLTAGDDGIMAGLREAMRRAGSRAALGASLADIVEFAKSAVSGEPPASDSMALQIPAVFAGQPLVTPALVEHAHRFGAAVHVWTIDDEAEMERLLELGVDGLVTDYPTRMAKVLRRA